jgi:hypothetical protein
VKYRVWCISWDDDEEAGRDIVAFDILTHSFRDEKRHVIYAPNTQVRTMADAAEMYADFAYRQRDGWDAGWPLTFRVRVEDGTFADFEVTMEQVPAFTAHPIKDKKRNRA